ncbi:MAG: DNA repair protein RecO [Nitrospirota bacterium]
MLKRTEGIVIRTVPYGEADLIVTYLTSDFGILKVFAKSPRKFRSRFGGSLEPLTHARIAFYGRQDASLPRLTQSDILNSFHQLREEFSSYIRLSEILELIIAFLPERDANIMAYSLLLNTLRTVAEKQNDTLLMTSFKIKFLHLVGFAPRLDSCGRCGRRGYTFYLAQGSIMCEGCARAIDSPFRISPAAVKCYADLLTWDIMMIHRIRPSPSLLAELSTLLAMHIRYILSKPLKTESFFNIHPHQKNQFSPDDP